MSEIERVGGTALSRGFEGATVTDVSMRFDADITTERAEEIVGLLGRIDRSAKWWLGDWVLQYADLTDRDDLSAVHVGAQQTGYSETALANWRDVTRLVPERLRDGRLDFTTYIELSRILANNLGEDLFVEARDRMIELRENWTRDSQQPFPNHKVTRQIVKQILDDRQLGDHLFDWPTTEEQIAEQSAEIDRLRTELEDARLAGGTHVRCPRCATVQSREEARVEIPSAA